MPYGKNIIFIFLQTRSNLNVIFLEKGKFKMNKIVLLTSVAMFALNISESRAAINCVFSNNGKTVTIIGQGSDSVPREACTRSNSSSEEEGWSYKSSWRSQITSANIGTGVTSIGQGAFLGAKSLTSITIPKGVTSIGDDAFGNASGLTSITIPEGVTSIGRAAFNSATGLTSITLPDSLTSIGDYAFQNATGLTSITIPKGVTSIGQYTFSRATGLTSITLPDTLTSIGNFAFQNATGLTSITIPEGVTSIGAGAFLGAKSLTSIIIPDNINIEGWSPDVIMNPTNIVCQGVLNTCYEKLARYFNSRNCPQSLKDAGKGNLCTCIGTCMSPSSVKEATSPSQCSGNYGWSGAGCSRKNADGSVDCASGFVEWDKQCWSEYPFAKKRWTPAEANEWLHDGNDNFVVITFKK